MPTMPLLTLALRSEHVRHTGIPEMLLRAGARWTRQFGGVQTLERVGLKGSSLHKTLCRVRKQRARRRWKTVRHVVVWRMWLFHHVGRIAERDCDAGGAGRLQDRAAFEEEVF
eukprot:522676-Prymnesium_polylepis.1